MHTRIDYSGCVLTSAMVKQVSRHPAHFRCTTTSLIMNLRSIKPLLLRGAEIQNKTDRASVYIVDLQIVHVKPYYQIVV